MAGARPVLRLPRAPQPETAAVELPSVPEEMPKRIDNWSLTNWQQRLVKTGGRLIKHSGYYGLPLAEGHLTRRLFGAMVGRIKTLPSPPG